MSSRLPVLLALSTLCTAAGGRAAAAETKRPNIVFVIADDLRHDGLGLAATRTARTPNIDRLAAEGLLPEEFLRRHPALLAQPRQLLDGTLPVRPPRDQQRQGRPRCRQPHTLHLPTDTPRSGV